MRRLHNRVVFLCGVFCCLYVMCTLPMISRVVRSRDHVHTSQSCLHEEGTHPPKQSRPQHVDVRASLQRYVDHVGTLPRQFNCDKLFRGEREETARAENFLSQHNHSFPTFPDTEFLTLTRDCDLFVQARDYFRSVTTVETEWPLAFTILTHGNVEELERLLRTIYTPNNLYCIHADLKSSPDFLRAVQSLTECFPNVFLATRLERVVYAHFSRLRAELNCMEDLLYYGKRWKYLINLAASELPLMSNLQIVNFVKKLQGRNDIREVFRKRRMERFNFRYTLINGTMQRSELRLPPPPHNLTVTKGLAYGVFSRHFLEFALTNQKARDFLFWCRNTHSPDEHFWATLNNLHHNAFLHSPGGSTAHPDKTSFRSRFVVWRDGDRKCSGRYRHNICVFGVGDLSALATSDKLIANKFDMTYDPIAFSCMEQFTRNRTLSQNQTLIS